MHNHVLNTEDMAQLHELSTVAAVATESLLKDPRSIPYHKYNPVSRALFCWVDSLFCYGACHTLQQKDLYTYPTELDAEHLLKTFQRYWTVEVSKHNNGGQARLSVALFKCIWWRILACSAALGFQVPLFIGISIFLGGITEYFNIDCPTSTDTRNAYLNALWLFMCSLCSVVSIALGGFLEYKAGIMLRIICTSAIYKKVLHLSQDTVIKLTAGHIVNLMSNDVHRFDQVFLFINTIWMAPALIILSAFILYNEIGVVSFIAIAMAIGQLPLQMLLSKLLLSIRLKAAKITDERVKVMNEVVTGIRVIKMYCWENAFHQLVSRIRHKEMMMILKSSVIKAMNVSMYATYQPTMMFAMFSVYAAMGECITLRKVFISLSLLTSLRLVCNFYLVLCVANISEGIVAIKRIQKFLLFGELEESKPDMKNMDGKVMKPVDNLYPIVEVNDLNCCWSGKDEGLSLNSISFTVNKVHPLMAVVGSVGAGKSTLLQCLLGELPSISGSINMEGTVAYAGQEPWVFSDTLRENILFGLPYIPDWYSTVIDLCTLDKDISILPDGDMTVVGERGVTLSGGQKARVGLARAVYRRAGIYLLDDPLSAVDTVVSRHIFDRCIKGFLTQSSVVILVTHQLQYVQQCDTVLVLNKGCVTMYGQPSNVLHASTDTTKLFTEKDDKFSNSNVFNVSSIPTDPSHEHSMKPPLGECEEMPEHNDVTSVNPLSNVQMKKEPLSESEDRNVGTITFRTYYNYLKAGGGVFPIIVLLILYVLGEVSLVLTDLWLATWSTNEDSGCATISISCNSSINYTSDPYSTLPTNVRIGVYGALVCSVWILCTARTVLFYIILLRAATSLHNKMFISVLRSPVLFFDTNPVGRILNRFSKDTGFLDDILITTFSEFLQFFARFVAIIITASIAVYYLIAFIIALVIGLIGFCWYFLKTSREIKRLESLARSPLYSHISMTLQGLPTIRGYGKQQKLLNTFYGYLNSHSQSSYLYIVTARWFGIRVDFVCALFVSLFAFVSIPLANFLTPAFVGLALTYTISLTGLFQYCVRHSTEIESLMVSAERIMSYTKLLPEEDGHTAIASCCPDGWPDKGVIEISDLCYKHSDDGPLVLRNINCTIKSGEKVGIVGRTGAGKSSLIGAFFRLAQPNGSIRIDGVECLDIPLADLRPRISIIPQDPVLFSGSVRYNLDPFGQYNDECIWTALNQVQLGSVVESLDGRLEAEVTEGGNNFSVGEKQLFCLARALIRQNKILMLDEATANVDLKTDSIIQRVIKQLFNECTVLTIAHRLATVMDSDRIMVLKSGEVLEYGEPYQLLCNPDSYLLTLVEQTGPDTANNLKEIAYNVHNSKQ